jgi:hypothetical protein
MPLCRGKYEISWQTASVENRTKKPARQSGAVTLPLYSRDSVLAGALALIQTAIYGTLPMIASAK